MPAFRGHDSARKFHCEVPGCSASFVKRAHLRRHEMTHTQRRDFSCPGCARAFSRNDSMARHLRRKHPHLYRSHDAAPTASTGVERLYTGSMTAPIGSSAAGSSSISSNAYGLMPLRPPFDHNGNNLVQRRHEDIRSLPDALGRPSQFADNYNREVLLHSPKGASTAQWRAASTSRTVDGSYATAYPSSNDGSRADQGRYNLALKEDPEYAESSQPFFTSTGEPTDRSCDTRRPGVAYDAAMHRTDWAQHPNAQFGSGLSHREVAQGAHTYRFPWERQEDAASFGPPCGSMGWTGPRSTSSGGNATVQSSDFDRREYAGTPYPDMHGPTPALPSGMPSAATMSHEPQVTVDAEALQSEFFVDGMRTRGGDVCWANLDPCMFTAQPSERIRVESGPEPSQLCPETTLAAPGPSVSPSGRSGAAAADTYFAVDFRGLCDPAAPAEPPSAGQVEQIMAELGLDFSTSQEAAVDTSHSFSSQDAFQRPHGVVSNAPQIPSQGGTTAPWSTDRHASANASVHIQPQSQAQSSQSSIYLPSLTASQSEYLGPQATSHRRPMDRVFSSASMAFDSGSQPRAHTRGTPSLGGEQDESFGDATRVADTSAESFDHQARDPSANFHKPHDSFLSQTAARDEEGDRKAGHAGQDSQNPGSSTDPGYFTSSDDRKGNLGTKREGVEESMTNDTDGAVAPCRHGAVDTMSAPMGPPSAAYKVSTDSHDKDDMEVDNPPLPEDAQQRNSSASIATSAVSGDQLQLVVDRFRVFAQLCQDHMHPSAEMLDCLAPLIPKVIRADVPFFHPKMICSQKVHSPEEAFALLSLVSLQSSDSHLKEEGHRLICFLYGLVMLSYKHTLQLGGKLQSFLNCFLLVGMHGVRQASPDLWLKFEENRESILLDVLRAETRNSDIDDDLDRIQDEQLQNLAEEDLFKLWSRWYEHESRKRTLLFCAIQDSQSSGYFSPLKLDLTSRPEGPRCQFLFAHVYEPCPDTIFLAWPPKAWATRLASGVSLPSAKGAKVAFKDGAPTSIAACLTEQLLRPHVAHVHTPFSSNPGFRSSFDFGASGHAASSSKPMRPGSDRKELLRRPASAPYVEVAQACGTSANSSRRPSRAEGLGDEQANTEARTVSQLYMLALLEAVHGAWMTDSGWYQTPAWGTAALPERLAIDDDDFDIEEAAIADLPGWRTGVSLHATQVAHALMNWSEMFSGSDDSSQQETNEGASKSGLQVMDDAYQLTIRWQAIFLGLCAPLQSLCYYLDRTPRSDSIENERHRRISLLLKKWVDSASCRRALVHVGTILTLLYAIKTKTQGEKRGPATSHAAYISLVVLVGVSKLLGETEQSAKRMMTAPRKDIISTRQVWTGLLSICKGGKPDARGQEADADKHAKIREEMEEGNRVEDDEWLRVRFWHRKFQYLGLAGIFREQEGSAELFADWRASISAGAEGGASIAALRAAQSRPRWSSFVGEHRWPTARRETIHVHGAGLGDQRRVSHAQLAASQPEMERDLLRRRVRGASASSNPWTETRRWILQGATHEATFCGLSLGQTQQRPHFHEAGPSAGRQQEDSAGMLTPDYLRGLIMWTREDDPAWCFSQEYASLLLSALQEPEIKTGEPDAPSVAATNSHTSA